MVRRMDFMDKYRKMKAAGRITIAATSSGFVIAPADVPGRARTKLQVTKSSVTDGTVLHAEGSFFHENQ